MAIPSPHTVTSYDDDLHRLRAIVGQIGALAESQLSDALAALAEHDGETARAMVALDSQFDALQSEAEWTAMTTLAQFPARRRPPRSARRIQDRRLFGTCRRLSEKYCPSFRPAERIAAGKCYRGSRRAGRAGAAPAADGARSAPRPGREPVRRGHRRRRCRRCRIFVID